MQAIWQGGIIRKDLYIGAVNDTRWQQFCLESSEPDPSCEAFGGDSLLKRITDLRDAEDKRLGVKHRVLVLCDRLGTSGRAH